MATESRPLSENDNIKLQVDPSVEDFRENYKETRQMQRFNPQGK